MKKTFFFIFFLLIKISLISFDALAQNNIPTPPCSYYGEEEVNGALTVGKQITVVDPDGVQIGSAAVIRNGVYGFVNTVQDDPATLEDEGAVDGDLITFYIDGVRQQRQALWKAGDIVKVDLGIPYNGYFNLHLDAVPAYTSFNNNPKYSGTAVADMILDFIDPLNTETQSDLMFFADLNLSGELELSELSRTLNIKAPSAYNFTSTETIKSYAQSGIVGPFDPTNQNEVMKQICHWIAYKVPNAEEGKEFVPVAAATSSNPAIAADSDYQHWMSIVGIRTNQDPFPALHSGHSFSEYYDVRDDLQIHGVYLNDPSQSGLGFHFYMAADVWTSQYFRPMAAGLESSGTYVALMEPAELKEKRIRMAPSVFNKNINRTLLIPRAGVSVYIPGWMNAKTRQYLEEIAKQLKDLEELKQLIDDEYFQKALTKSTIKRCFKVDGGQHGDYTIVPFEKLINKREATTAALIFNNATGQFMTAFADPEADNLYQPMSWSKAYFAFRKKIGWGREYPVNYWHVFKTGSPLYPGWKMVTVKYDQGKSRSSFILTTNTYSIDPDETVELEDQSPQVKILYERNYKTRGRTIKILLFEVESQEEYTVEMLNQKKFSTSHLARYRNRWILVLSDYRRLQETLKIQTESSKGNIREGGMTYMYLY